MTRVVLPLTLLLFAPVFAWSVPEEVRPLARVLPQKEVRILLAVGREYALAGDELRLLFTIRRIEQGRAGVEMGVGSDYPGHPARRYAGNFDRSLRLQARWAAGTIKKRYRGNLESFARRYCPPRWRHWQRMASYWMEKEA